MPRPSAFDILYREYYARVLGLCRRLLNSSDQAEDAAQETFARAYRRFNSFKADQPFWQWIAAIASNHCIDLLRGRKRGAALFDADAIEPDALAADQPATLSRVIAEREADAVNRAIDQLPDRYRVPLLLAYHQQLDHGAIAEQLGTTRNNVGVLLLRGRRQLRELLDVAGEVG